MLNPLVQSCNKTKKSLITLDFKPVSFLFLLCTLPLRENCFATKMEHTHTANVAQITILKEDTFCGKCGIFLADWSKKNIFLFDTTCLFLKNFVMARQFKQEDHEGLLPFIAWHWLNDRLPNIDIMLPYVNPCRMIYVCNA